MASSAGWTPGELLQLQEKVEPALGIIGTVLVVISLVIYYTFPRLRKFPASILSWVSYYNLLYAVYLIWKWSPGSALHESWAVDVIPGSIQCRFMLFIETFTCIGAEASNMVLAFSVFLAVRFLVKTSEFRVYLVSFVWIYPAVTGICFALIFDTYVYSSNSCDIHYVSRGFLRIPFFFFLVVQFFLYGYSIYATNKLVAGINASTATEVNFGIWYLIVRLVAAYAVEIWSCGPAQVLAAMYGSAAANGRFLLFAELARASGPILDALVVILGNSEFRAWSRKMFQLTYLQRRHTHLEKEHLEKEHTPIKECQIAVAIISESKSSSGSDAEFLSTLSCSEGDV